MTYVPPPDPACSPVPLGIQAIGSLNNARANIPDYSAPDGITATGPTPTPAVPSPTPTPQARSSITNGNAPTSPKVTRTATQTATASNPINPVDYPDSVLKRGDIDTGLSLPSNTFGPYPQTLFLGCSVVSFNVSLGWGNQPSSLSVTLVEDTAPHYTMTHDGGIYRSTALGLLGSVNHYYNTLKPTKNAKGVVDETAANYKTRIASFLDTNGNLIIPGKIFYHYNTSVGRLEQKYWIGPDPGFIASRNRFRRNGRDNLGTDPIIGTSNVQLGEAVDIIGCPVFFQLDDFTFCGIVKSWRSVNSGTGGRSYQVDIEGPNDIINNAQIILNNYTGSVFTKNTSGDISGPTNDIWSNTIPITTGHQGNVSVDGNIPNLINVYGFLEAMGPGGFGTSGINDDGMPTNNIIYTLNYLLGLPSSSSTKPGETTRNMFSPFGALVSRSPMTATPKSTDSILMKVYNTSDSDIPKVSNDTYGINYTNIASGPHLGFPNSRRREVSSGGNSVAGTVSGFLEIGDDGSVARNTSTPAGITTGTVYNIFDFGLIPPDNASLSVPAGNISNQQYKQLYFLDLGELPEMPVQKRTDCNQAVMDLNTFITEICDSAGIDFFYEMLYIKVYSSSPAVKIIKLRTVSRRVQPSDRAISDYIAKLRDNGVTINSVSIGKEYNSSAKPRTLLMGGKQQRLFQTKNYGLAYRCSDYIYHTTQKRLLHYDNSETGRSITNGEFLNKYRVPNPGSIRDVPAINRDATISFHNEIPVGDNNYYSYAPDWVAAYTSSTELALPVKGNYYPVGTNTTSSFSSFSVDSVTTKNSNLNITNSSQFIMEVGKALFSWAYTHIVSKSRASSGFDVNLHQSLVYQSGGSSSIFSSSPVSSYLNQQLEATTLQNLAKSIADFGYNTYNISASHYFNNKPKYLFNESTGWTRDSADTRFFPIMYNSVCPFFGTVDYIDKSKQYNLVDKTNKPRCVWFDTWQNCLVIEFNVRELPITKLNLEGIYDGGTFYVTESELRAAVASWDSWIGYLSMRIHDPHIKQMIKNATCGSRKIPPASPPTPPSRERDQAPAPNAADTGANANLGPGQGANKPKQKDTKSDFQVTSDNDWDACAIFTSIFKIRSAFNEKTKSASAGAAVPKNTKSGLNFALTADLKLLHEFFRKIGDEFYGKKFMVRLPMILSYRDRHALIDFDPRPTPTRAPTVPSGGTTTTPIATTPTLPPPNAGTQPPPYINIGTTSNPRYVTEGSGKIYSNYKISPEGAWEEYGNTIDDSIMIGGYTGAIFTDEQGRIQPILGFPANDRFDHEAYEACRWIKEHACKLVNGPNIFYFYDVLKRGNVFSNANRYTDFDPNTKPMNNQACP